jgi:membrane protease YdiL (CAAX protease family)
MKAGGGDARIVAYRQALRVEWLLAAIILGCWYLAERSAAHIGLGAPRGWPFLAGVGVVLVYLVLGVRQIAELRTSAQAREKVRGQLQGDVGVMIPRTPRELRFFTALGVTAGICEEIAYRGFLTWYLAAFVPVPVAAGIGAAIFGFAHLYLGRGNVLRTGLIGLVFAAAYLLTGSLWVPILLHAAIDVVSGNAGYAALEEGAGPSADVG